ncbi:hypothetical protein Tco_0080524 [Tanacetum coccineum]
MLLGSLGQITLSYKQYFLGLVRSIPAARPNQVSTGRPKPVSTGRPKPVPTDKQRCTPEQFLLVGNIGLFQFLLTYTPYVPQVYNNHMQYGRVRWETAVKPSTGNMEILDDYVQEFQGGKVTFGGGEGRITRKGTIRTPTLDFENVYYVKELQHFNLFPISQICDKKNRVLFTDTDCLVLPRLHAPG